MQEEESVECVWDRFVNENKERLCREMDRALLVLLSSSSTSPSLTTASVTTPPSSSPPSSSIPLSSSPSSSSPSSSSSPPSVDEEQQESASPDSRSGSKVLMSATTIRPLYHASALQTLNPLSNNGNSQSANIILCGDTTSSLTVESEVEQAQAIFNRLFPHDIFLPQQVDKIDENENDYSSSANEN